MASIKCKTMMNGKNLFVAKFTTALNDPTLWWLSNQGFDE
jgi:hypothetical protein